MNPYVDSFYAFCVERDLIWRRREAGYERPWTTDPVLDRYWFTNVHRDRDPGSMWILEKAQREGLDGVDLLWTLYVYRAINKVETFERYGLPPRNGFALVWVDALSAASADGYAVGNARHFTAFRRVAKAVDWWCSEVAGEMSDMVLSTDYPQVAAKRLCDAPWLGLFTAVQVVGDLVGLCVVLDGPMPLPPGSEHALKILMTGADAEYLRDGSSRGRVLITQEETDMLVWLKESQPTTLSKPMTYVDLEHALCEWSKWLRLSTVGIVGMTSLYKPKEARR